MLGVTFYLNFASALDIDGGTGAGLMLVAYGDAKAHVAGARFTSNTSERQAAGLSVFVGGAARVDLLDAVFTGNVGNPAAIDASLSQSGSLRVGRTQIQGNTWPAPTSPTC
jgi:hypothetical protein